jgi:hypothetical protein
VPTANEKHQEEAVTATKTRNHYSVVERDGALALVRSLTDGAETFVDFDAARKKWVCSECGPVNCDHVATATRRLPLDVASQVAATVAAPRKPGTLSTKTGGAKVGEEINQRALAAALARSAEARVERNRRHDDEHQQVTSKVSIRKACKEDAERLRLARERKQRTYQPPVSSPPG